jgi:RNA polymerase-binding transcription factor DksA
MSTTHASHTPQRAAFPVELADQLRQRLEAERATLLARPAIDPDNAAFSLTATYGQGETELATRDIELALATTRAHADAASIASIAAALARLDDVTYGICEACATVIPVERLVALPDAARCVNCERALTEQR